MSESGIIGSGNLSESDLELASVDQVSAADAARRAREREELVDLLSLFAGAAPNLCCNNLDAQSGTGQAGSCCGDGPGTGECVGDCSGECADPQPDLGDGRVGVISDGLFDRSNDAGQQSQFMHPPMMPGSGETSR